MSIFTKLSIF